MNENYNEKIKISETIKILANAIGGGETNFAAVDIELFTEIVNAIFDENIGNDYITCKELKSAYINMLKDAKEQQNNILMKDFLYVLASTIEYNQIKEEYLLYQTKGGKQPVITQAYDARELFLQQNGTSGNSFERWDTVVRYLAIENYFGLNDYGFKLYRKMQSLRMGEDYVDSAETTFKNLIKSFDKNGYDNNSSITCDENLKLLDGSHRLALALYFGIPKLLVLIKRGNNKVEYSEKWFIAKGFTIEERELIRNKANELIAKCKVPFECILWPSAEHLFENITKDLGEIYPIVSYKDYEFKDETFSRLVYAIYNIDDIEKWKIQKKLECMNSCCNKKIRVVKLDIDSPLFRLKASTCGTLSRVGEYIKSFIREKYKEKIDNYFYDIIIHIGDNFEQNEYVDKLFKQAFSLKDYLNGLLEYRYYLTKIDTPYQTNDFPNTYAFSKDLDIICEEKDFDSVVEYTRTYLSTNITQYDVAIKTYKNKTLFRIELKDVLIYQLDISCQIDGLDKTFIDTSMSRRILKDGYYIAALPDEISIRKNEYYKNPRKVHHLKFIEKAQEDLLE